MSVLEFINDLVGSLAWPVTVVAVALLFRGPIRALFKDRRLTKLSANTTGLSAEFSHALDDLRADVAEAVKQPDETPSPEQSGTAFDDLEASGHSAPDNADARAVLAALSPAAAVVHAFAAVELCLREFHELVGLSRPNQSAPRLAADLRRIGVLADADVTAVGSLSKLRNVAAHPTPDRSEITASQAIDYSELCDELVGALQGKTPQIYEKAVLSALRRVRFDISIEAESHDRGWDATLSKGGRSAFVEIKFIRSGDVARRIRDIRSRIDSSSNVTLIVVTNNVPTALRRRERSGMVLVQWRGPGDDEDLRTVIESELGDGSANKVE